MPTKGANIGQIGEIMSRKGRKPSITAENKAEVGRLLKKGLSYRAVGEKTGISKSKVGQIAAELAISADSNRKAAVAPAMKANQEIRVTKNEERIAKFERLLALQFASSEAAGQMLSRAHQDKNDAGISRAVTALAKVPLAAMQCITKLHELEGRALPEDATGEVMDVVELVKHIEGKTGKKLSMEVLDALGELDD